MARVVLTREPERGVAHVRELLARGHEVRCVPLTVIVGAHPFPDPAPFDGVLFTSVNSVERAPVNATWPRVGAVGAVTASALAARRIRVDVTGDGGGAALAAAWAAGARQRLLLPQAVDAHPALADALRAAGAEVICAPVYASVPNPDVDRGLLEEAEVICFFAPSHVQAFVQLALRTRARFVAHGSTTRAAMGELGPVVDLDEI